MLSPKKTSETRQILLTPSNVQKLVRLHKFDFGICSSTLRKRKILAEITPDDVRIAFATKSGLYGENNDQSNSKYYGDSNENLIPMKQHKELQDTSSYMPDEQIPISNTIETVEHNHKERCNAAFFRAAGSIAGIDNNEKHLKGVGLKTHREIQSDKEGKIDKILNEQKDRLRSRFDVGSIDSQGEDPINVTKLCTDSMVVGFDECEKENTFQKYKNGLPEILTLNVDTEYKIDVLLDKLESDLK